VTGSVPSMSGIVRAAAYARISDDSEETILENQLEGVRSYCRDKGFELREDNIYSEVATGTAEKQARLNDMLSAASKRNRAFDLVVFPSLSRMTRGGVEAALYVLRRLEQSGVGWHILEQPTLNFDSTTPKLVKDILLSVLAAIDEDYRARIRRATRAAYQKRKNLLAPGEKIRWGRPPGSKNRKRGPPGSTSDRGGINIAPISGGANR
jgi:DNA invertase Pin-like site-specific DNA recombinase